MKRILVTGGAGLIGRQVIKYLLSEGKYEITVIDIKTKDNIRVLKKYQRRINIIFVDSYEQNLIDSLIKESDAVIHLAGLMPPLCNLDINFGKKSDYEITEKIVKSISFYNPKCFLIYTSSTTLYEESVHEVSFSGTINIDKNDYYSKIKKDVEDLIKDKIKNYVIFRIPFVLNSNGINSLIFLYKPNILIETIIDQDVSYALVKSLEKEKELNKKIRNLSGGPNCRINSNILKSKILESSGLCKEYIKIKIQKTYTYDGFLIKDDKKVIDCLEYRNDSIDSYFIRLSRTIHPNKFALLIAKPWVKSLKKSAKKI